MSPARSPTENGLEPFFGNVTTTAVASTVRRPCRRCAHPLKAGAAAEEKGSHRKEHGAHVVCRRIALSRPECCLAFVRRHSYAQLVADEALFSIGRELARQDAVGIVRPASHATVAVLPALAASIVARLTLAKACVSIWRTRSLEIDSS